MEFSNNEKADNNIYKNDELFKKLILSSALGMIEE